MKEFDLEKRTSAFAKSVIRLCQDLPRTPVNDRLTGQCAGAAGSIGANYREANDSLGKKDFLQKLRIARREAKEAQYWLELISEANARAKSETALLLAESQELRNILSAIIAKVEKKDGEKTPHSQ